MRTRRKTQNTKQKKVRQNVPKLKECYVKLYDITLYPELIPLRYKWSFQQQLKQIKSSCIKTPKSLNYIQLSQQNVQEVNTQSNKFIQKSPLQSTPIRKKRKECKTTRSRLSSKNIKSTKESKKEVKDYQSVNKIHLSTFINHKLRTLIDSEDDSFDNETSNKIRSHIPEQKGARNTKVLQHARKLNISSTSSLESSKDTINSNSSDSTYDESMESTIDSDNQNSLDEKNLIFINPNNKIQKEFSKEECIEGTKHYRNLTPVDSMNGTNHKVKQKCSQSKKSLTITDVNSKFSTNKSFKNIKTDEESNDSCSSNIFSSTSNNNMNKIQKAYDTIIKSKDENEPLTIGQSLLKISQNLSLPCGKRIKIVRPNGTYIRAQESISNNSNLEPNECNNRNTNVIQTLNIDDTLKHTDILREKEDVSSTIINSNNISKTPNCILTSKNDIKDKNILGNGGFHNKVFNYRSSNSLTITENINHNNVNIDDSSNKAATNTNCTADHQISSQKRTIEKNNEVINTCAKRIKLKRNFQQNIKSSSNNTLNIDNHIEPSNQLKFNDSSSIDTTSKDAKYNEIDLRKVLEQKRTEKTYTLEALDNQIINNAIPVGISNENNITAITNEVENEEICDKLSPKETLTFIKDSYEEQNNAQINSLDRSDSHLYNNLYDTLKETRHNQIDTNTCEDTNIQKNYEDNVHNDNDYDNEIDDDCISLYAETLDISQHEDTFPNEKEKLSEPVNSDKPYLMSNSSFNKFIKQNTNEFNREYERCMNNIKHTQIAQNNAKKASKEIQVAGDNLSKMSNESELLKVEQTLTKVTQNVPSSKGMVLDKQLERTSHTDLPTSSNLTLNQNTQIRDIHTYFYGFCFSTLTYSKCCYRGTCIFRHNFQDFVSRFYFRDSNTIMEIIIYAKYKKFYFFCQEMYKMSLQKLNIDEILAVYKMFYEICILTKNITCHVINELLRRTMSLKTIVDRIVEFIHSSIQTAMINQNYEILQCLELFIKSGEYWHTARNILLILKPNKYIIEKIIHDCTRNENLTDIQDINDMLISKLSPGITAILDEHLMARFKSLLTEKAAKNTSTVKSVQDFGDCTEIDTIASPDSRQSSHRTESPKRCVIAVTNKSQTNEVQKCDEEVNASGSRPYILQPIDDLQEPRSIYREHENLWKFYVDLDRFKQGLKHQDYDYVIDILEDYAGRQDENLFVRSCCNILRREIKRSEYHLTNIIRRTVQTGTFAILREILFDMGIDILVALMDEDAWRLAFYFVQSLKTFDLPSTAEFAMLLAEIYLANKKALEALDLFRNKNIICTSRAKWRVMSTVHDEYIRNKLIYILLDSLCNGLIDHAFFLFTFLLKDQSNQFYPIDLSRYVDKLIILLLLRNDTTLIIEMVNLILKYNFPLNAKTCRMLITTLIHIDEKLAMQLYCYAEAIGFYSTLETYPITRIIIKNDLTEEEVYFVILQLLEKLKVSFGHTIEFIKSNQIAVYLIFEVKSTEQFYCAEQQSHYNSLAIANIKALVRNVLKTRFDPPILLLSRAKEKICRLQNKSLINYLQSEHCH